MKPKPALPRRAVYFGGKRGAPPIPELGHAPFGTRWSLWVARLFPHQREPPDRPRRSTSQIWGTSDALSRLSHRLNMGPGSAFYHVHQISCFSLLLFILFILLILKLFGNIPFGIFGGPEKDLGFLVVWGCSSSFSSDAPGQLNVLWHDCHPLCMDGTQVGVFKESHQVGFRGFL